MAIYLDYNATAPVRAQVVDFIKEIMSFPANGSSVHSYGRLAKKAIEDARKIIADHLSVWSDEIIFTASATEANNMVMNSFPAASVCVSAIEHSSILKCAGIGELVAKVSSDGVVDLGFLDVMLSMHKPKLLSVMLANNETGAIQPIQEISQLCKKHGVLLHCDAVQGLGKIAVDAGALGVDLMTISSHKCGGPVGAAALIVRRGVEIQPFLRGGGQEMRKRAGTENVAAIAGFAKAVELAHPEEMFLVRQWLDWMERSMVAKGGVVVAQGASRLPNTSCVILPGVNQETQLMAFDLKGVCVSAGSACSSGRIEPSHVLLAMGYRPDEAGSAIRISAGWATTESDIIAAINAWLSICERLAIKSA